MNNTISIKGTREGLTITLVEGEFPVLLRDLSQHLSIQGEFFRGGAVALQVGNRVLAQEDLMRLSEMLQQYDMALRTVMTTDATTEQSARALGLRLVTSQPAQASTSGRQPLGMAVSNPLDGTKGVLIRHLVRSGQVVRHTGHVAIIGDVNPGAEIIAGGDVVVWGRLYGTVHAGAMDNNEAVVCALELSPMQLRIGQVIARAEEGTRSARPSPEVASVRDDRILVEPWDQGPRGR